MKQKPNKNNKRECESESNNVKSKRKRRTNNKRTQDYKDEGYMTSVRPNVITSGEKDNDASWYMHLDPIAKDYASVPMSQVLGLSSTNWARSTASPNLLNANEGWTAYGFMVLNFMPTIGQNDGSTAAVNLSAQQLYTLIRRNASGTLRFDKTDVMMLMLAMDSAYMLYEDLLRAYRVMSTFSSVNRYYPNSILTALGYDVNLASEITWFRGILDMFAYKLASVNIPDQLDLIKRHSWMCSNIYLDNNSNKAQSYAFTPTHLYQWVEGTESEATHLNPVQIHAAPLTKNTIPDLINQFMDPILGSEDVGEISSMAQKAFGESGMIKIKPVEDYAALVPVYSEEVLMQIRNTFMSPGLPTFTAGAMATIVPVLSSTVKGPYLRQRIACTPGADGGRRIGVSPLLNFINEDATPENVLVATRLMTLTSAVGSGGLANFIYYGTEIIVGIQCYRFDATDNLVRKSMDQDLYFSPTMSASNLAANAEVVRLNAEFRNSPANYLFVPANQSAPDDTYNYIGATTDINDYVYMDDQTLKDLHEVAVMSLFTVKDYSPMLF